ncbi:MAG: sulfate reduction electron transfer complex DsrMKJOP subunit DsrJ [Dehalococcoidales bacterium]|nr:sulfate reduction electron transfer complex DsrMKJOP subunit DsrJ [Dehalococcoidales bacterium]
MYDADKIIPGLIIFFCLITFPIWYSAASGKATYVPKPEIVTEEKQCIEPRQYMRCEHMALLNCWRESVVHQGIRTYVASDGKEYNISLIGTCLGCHSNKAEFCDKCHNYVGVKPNCWDCHTPPKRD